MKPGVPETEAVLGETPGVELKVRNEGTPVALIESAAAGRPAVATAVGGVPDVVVPGTGLLVAPGDDAALADRLRRLEDAVVVPVDAEVDMLG